MSFEWPDVQLGFNLQKHSILVTLAGSRSYGTNMPGSDTDYKGIVVPPIEYYISPFKNFEQVQWKSEAKSGRLSQIDGVPEAESEGTFFGISKFVKLAAACNPNVIETLFVADEHVVHITDAGQKLREHRELFLSQRAAETFVGYAKSQLKRIKTHKSWIDNPPMELKTREEFGLPKEKLIRPDQRNAAERFVERNVESFAPWLLDANNQHKEAFWEGVSNIVAMIFQEAGLEFNEGFGSWIEIEGFVREKMASGLGFDDNFIEYLQLEKKYAREKQHYKQYQGWTKNRNSARAELEARYGYDVKHGMHLVRLLRMGEEVLTEGTMNVFRPDREELKRIRNGEWTFDQLIEWAEARERVIKDLVLEGRSVVPKQPDVKKIEQITAEIIDSNFCANEEYIRYWV